MVDTHGCPDCVRTFVSNQSLGIHRGRSHPVSVEEAARIRERHLEGASKAAISAEFGRSFPTLDRALAAPAPREEASSSVTAIDLVDAFLARVEEARTTIKALSEENRRLEKELAMIKTYDAARLSSQLTTAQAKLSQPISITTTQEEFNHA